MYGRAALALALVLIPPTQSGCFCTAIGCLPGASIEVNTPYAVEELEGATMTFCVNGQCVGYLVLAENYVAENPADPQAFSMTMRRGTLGGADLFLDARPPDDARDGDVYRIELRSTAGAVLVERSWTASYERFYPNGEHCDDGCLRTQLTPAS